MTLAERKRHLNGRRKEGRKTPQKPGHCRFHSLKGSLLQWGAKSLSHGHGFSSDARNGRRLSPQHEKNLLLWFLLHRFVV